MPNHTVPSDKIESLRAALEKWGAASYPNVLTRTASDLLASATPQPVCAFSEVRERAEKALSIITHATDEANLEEGKWACVDALRDLLAATADVVDARALVDYASNHLSTEHMTLNYPSGEKLLKAYGVINQLNASQSKAAVATQPAPVAIPQDVRDAAERVYAAFGRPWNYGPKYAQAARERYLTDRAHALACADALVAIAAAPPAVIKAADNWMFNEDADPDDATAACEWVAARWPHSPDTPTSKHLPDAYQGAQHAAANAQQEPAADGDVYSEEGLLETEFVDDLDRVKLYSTALHYAARARELEADPRSLAASTSSIEPKERVFIDESLCKDGKKREVLLDFNGMPRFVVVD